MATTGSSRLGVLIRRTPWLTGLPREVAVLAAIAFCVALGYGIVAPSIPIFASTFGVDAFAAGAVVSVFALMRLVGAPGAGALVNRIGERRVLATGLVIVAASSFVAGFSGSYVQLLVLRGVGGLGSAMFTVSALALLLRTAGPAQRGRAAGAFQAGFLFGGVTGPAVGGLVVGWSIRAPFFLYAGTLALATFVTLRYLRDPREADPAVAESAAEAVEAVEEPGEATEAVAAIGQPADQPVTLWAALRNRAYVAALVANLTTGFTAFGLRISIVPLFVINGLHLSAGFSGLGFLVSAAAQAIVLLPAGRLADRAGRRPAIVIGTAASVLGMLGLVADDGWLLFLISMAVLGAAAAFLGSAPAATVGDITGGHRGGTVVATFQMIADVGAIAGPLLAGLLADQVGFGAAFATGAAVSLVAVGFAATMPETHRPGKARESG